MISRLLTSAAALGLTAGMAAAEYKLTILHTNDIHSRIESINKYDSTCGAEDEAEGKCFGGIARVKAKVDEMRSALEFPAATCGLTLMDAFFAGTGAGTARRRPSKSSRSYLRSADDAFSSGRPHFIVPLCYSVWCR